MAAIHRRPRSKTVQKAGLPADQLLLVLNILKKSSCSLDRGTFFNLLVDTIHREMKTLSHVSVFEWDSTLQLARALATAGDGKAEWTAGRLAPPTTVFSEVISTGSSVVTSDFSAGTTGL